MLRRWLLAVLAFMLSAQFAWAAAAAYCGHEANPAAAHVGHHLHKHRAAPSDAAHADTASDAAKSPLGADHPDCGYCHGGVAQPVALKITVAAMPAGRRFVPPAPQPFPCAVDDDIDRPKWTRLG
jgi:hypothetical protein